MAVKALLPVLSYIDKLHKSKSFTILTIEIITCQRNAIQEHILASMVATWDQKLRLGEYTTRGGGALDLLVKEESDSPWP